jgi:hypothetical protein
LSKLIDVEHVSSPRADTQYMQRWT